MLGPDSDDRGRLDGIAHLAEGGNRRKLVAFTKVAYEPVLLEVVVREPDSERRAHETGATVGADREPGPNRVALPTPIGRGQLHLVPGDLDRVDRHALADLDGRKRLAAAVEHRLDMGLVHHVERRPAAPRWVVIGDLQQRLAAAVDPVVIGLHDRPREDLVDQVELLEGAHDLVVEAGGSGQVVQASVLLEHHDAVAQAAHQRGQHHPGRSVADDGQVVGARCRPAIAAACVHGATLSTV